MKKTDSKRTRRIIYVIIIIIIIMAGVYFLLSRLRNKPTQETATTTETGYNKESCEKAGGEWGRLGIPEEERCNLPTMDKDRKCTDISQCQGECIADSEDAREGKCSDYMINLGCLHRMRDGKAITICAD